MTFFSLSRGIGTAVAVLFMLTSVWTAISGVKLDKVGLRNGDNLTCEIKKLESGLLKVSTDDIGTISIEWDKIVSLSSKELYEIDMANGAVHFGSLGNTSTASLMALTSDTLTVIVSRTDVVKLIPIKGSFWLRLNGSVSFGFNYAKATGLLQLNSAADITYRGRKFESKFTFNSVTTAQSGVDQSRRLDITFDQRFLFPHRWFGTAGLGLQKNSALGLDLRLSLQGGGGNQIIQTSSEWLSLGTGLSGNKEWVSSDSGNSYNLEGYFTIEHSKFRYDRPHLNLSTSISPFFNLTHLGRYRLEFNTNLSFEILADFYIKLSLYDSFNSEPPPDAARNDWNTTFSLSYTL